ncbi:ATP synthase subunit I [Candidatus Contubernalis alkaliaceticus]|uniref:ATP synthase subunit I n=1 Tax=Candidatus Contubernalis alkaliaceticus TaxID=338645 RepID=UPI001F4C37FC|nr:ATP synthase subunit I [Candidatus Contubernalis alkalaceticus]UNC93666.1 ATP synthase subunit I [Candidatus Contubernalis alkalaceticus]
MKTSETIWIQISMTCIKISLVVMVVLFIRQDYPAVVGLLLGTVAAVVKFYFLANSLTKSMEMSSSKASTYSYTRYIMRQVFTAGVLIVAVFVDSINFFWAVGGILLPQAVIVGGQVYESIKAYLKLSRKTG